MILLAKERMLSVDNCEQHDIIIFCSIIANQNPRYSIVVPHKDFNEHDIVLIK